MFSASCGTDYSVITKENIEVIQEEQVRIQVEAPETEVIIDFFEQPEKPENLDVLVVLDTSCSMSDNFENVSAGLDILRGDIELLTYDYAPGPDSENRFLIFANYYNKMIIDICGDFQLALAENSFLIKPITHMGLSRFPIEKSIVVYQDGIKEEDWYYLSSTNTVYFEFEILEGAAIKIGYETLVN